MNWVSQFCQTQCALPYLILHFPQAPVWATSTLAQYAMHSLPYVQKSLPQTGLYTNGVFAQLHPAVAHSRDERLACQKLICTLVGSSNVFARRFGVEGTFAGVGLPQCAGAGCGQHECSRRQQHDGAHGRPVAVVRCRVEAEPRYRLHRPQGMFTTRQSSAQRHMSYHGRNVTVTAHQHKACGGSVVVPDMPGGWPSTFIGHDHEQRTMCNSRRSTEAFATISLGDQGSDHRRCRRPRQPSSAVSKCSARATRPVTLGWHA